MRNNNKVLIIAANRDAAIRLVRSRLKELSHEDNIESLYSVISSIPSVYCHVDTSFGEIECFVNDKYFFDQKKKAEYNIAYVDICSIQQSEDANYLRKKVYESVKDTNNIRLFF